jgi:O-antigen/teichoic acid export membrane protein
MTAIILPLRQRVLRSGTWVMAGYFASQVLRLVGNLVLTRLLFPEAFGLMAIVQAVLMGVNMLSDVGTTTSIIQHAHGNAPRFLNTAWTMQIVRGLSMWLVISLLAFPLSRLYGEPQLAHLLPVAALTAVISAFNSTKLATADRNLDAVRVTIIDVGSYVVGLVVMVVLAWQFKSVWSLVWGNIATTVAKAITSHTWLRGLSNRLDWDRTATGHLLSFGRWIFLSSAVTFFAGEGNRLLLGTLLDVRQLSFFTLASTMNLMFYQAMQHLSSKVLFPAYSEIVRTQPAQMRQALIRARLALVLPSWLLAVGFIFFGDSLMQFLYDPRYHDSGSMLQILALGSLAGSLGTSYVGVLWAKGMLATHTALLTLHICLQLSGIFIGFHLLGVSGVVLGLSASAWLMYPAQAWVYRRLGLWFPGFDLSMLALSLVISFIAWQRITIV